MKREQRCKDNKTLMRCLTRRGQKKLFYVCDRCGLGAVKDSRSVEWLPAGAKVKSPPEGFSILLPYMDPASVQSRPSC